MGGAASSSLVRLLDREPGQANRRLIQRRRVCVYMSACVFVERCACIDVCVRV